MGMGGYFLGGEDFPLIWEDGEKSNQPMREFFDAIDSRKVYSIEGITNLQINLIKELQDILSYLTDTDYVSVFDLTEKDLKKWK